MTRPTDAVRSAVRAALLAEPAGAAGQPLALVACSGGPDSLALAAGASQAARATGWRIGAVVVDHQLQPGSGEVAATAAQQCRDLGLRPVEVRAVAVAADGTGPEAAARRARYAAIASVAAALGARAVLLAHSLDDQAETVLLGLARGSGGRSLAGMPDSAPLPGSQAQLLRPLLGLRRETLLAACRSWGLQPWLDPHNEDPRYTRVRVRRDLLPALAQVLGPGVPQALARTARLLRDDDDALTALADEVLRRLAGLDPPAPECALLAAQHPAIRRRVLQRLVLAAGSPAARITASHLLDLDAMVVAGTGSISLPGRVIARVRCGRLELVRRQE